MGSLMKDRGYDGLPKFSQEMYNERYFLTGENYDQWLDRVAGAYSDNKEHAGRIKKYISNYWFIQAHQSPQMHDALIEDCLSLAIQTRLRTVKVESLVYGKRIIGLGVSGEALVLLGQML